MFLKYISFFVVLRIFCFCGPVSKDNIVTTTVSNSGNGTCMEIDDKHCADGYQCDFSSNECVPYCSIECGPGSCIGPETCNCNPGYYSSTLIEDSEPPRCKPFCENCEGTCIQPYLCVCETEFDAKNVSANDGECDCFGNCTGRICDGTKCIPKSSIETTTDQWTGSRNTRTSSESYADIGESDVSIVGTFLKEKDMSIEVLSRSFEKENELKEEIEQGSYTWMYLTVGLVSLLTAVIVIITKRHAVLNCFTRNGYSSVEEKLEEPQSHSMDMNFLTVKRNEYNT